MKFFLAACLALLPTLAIAHPGHMESVSGHSHTLAELVAYGVAFGVLALLILLAVRAKSNG